MTGKMMFVAVSRPVIAKRKPKTLEEDADAALLELVNAANRKRMTEQRKQALLRWIGEVKKREAELIRRERIVSKKEAKLKAVKRTANFVTDSLLVIFSTIGLVTTIVFFFGL